MTDIAQQNLKEPEQLDWDTAFSGSKYSAPPPALGPDGKPITYYGLIKEVTQTEPEEGYLNYQIDLVLTRAGQYDGQRMRTWVSTRPFTRMNKETGQREPMKGNPNKLASLLRAAGLQAKPQTNSEYVASVKAINGRPIPFTVDWVAKNKDTGEVVKGFNSFPLDPASGTRKSILRQGDTINEVDSKGAIIGTKTVASEVLFANAQIKYFQDSTKAAK